MCRTAMPVARKPGILKVKSAPSRPPEMLYADFTTTTVRAGSITSLGNLDNYTLEQDRYDGNTTCEQNIQS